MSRRFVGPLVTLLLIVGVGAAIKLSVSEQFSAMNIENVRGVSGSEKLPFFHDERTIASLQQEPHHIDIQVEKAGSRQIATSYNLKEYDFAFPAGIPAAEKIRREQHVKNSFQPFFTPMVIASWRPIAEILMENGLVEEREGSYYIVDMNALFRLIIEKKRWTDLKGHEKYPANKSILVTTTDIRKSNSAAMYLALASYVLNNNAIVQNDQQADAIIGSLASLFLRQGFTENSSAVPFQDYLTMGPGKTPMVMIYESQFLYESARENSAITPDMVLLYPEPTLFTKHVFIPFSENGKRLGEALNSDEHLQQIATDHGLRTENTALFREFLSTKGLTVPTALYNVIEPPSYEVLEHMIQQIEHRYNGETIAMGNKQ